MSLLDAAPARALLEPTWWAAPEYVYTYGPEVADLCARAGFAPDPEQELLLDGTFGVNARGLSAAFEIDIIAARQNLKTGSIIQDILGWLFVTDQRLVVYSSFDLRSAEETWRITSELIEKTPMLSKRLMPGRGERPGIVEGNGRWAVNLRGGRRAIFVTRGNRTGRSLAGDKVVLDEGFAVTATQIGSLLPVLSARPDPQYVIASSAGKADSTVLKDARDKGRAGGTDRQLYAEWGDRNARKGCRLGERCTHHTSVPGCALDDEDRWRQIMPALGGRVRIETVRGLRDALPPAEFAREFMVWWDLEGDGPAPAIDPSEWVGCRDRRAEPPTRFAVFLDVTPSRSASAIGVTGAGEDGQPVVLVKTAPGTGWVVGAVRTLQDLHPDGVVEVALNPGTQAGVLIQPLIEAGIDYELITSQEAGQACGDFQEKVKAQGIRHRGQKALDDAVANAITRFSGEIEFWDRRDRDGPDIAAVVAASGSTFRWGLISADDYPVEDSYL